MIPGGGYDKGNIAVMSWRGEDGGLAAAKMKHDVVMTPSAFCYLDLKQGNPELEPELESHSVCGTDPP